MKNGIFVSGTDTGVGKTIVSTLLVSALRQANLKSGYFKPIQTGTDADTPTVSGLLMGASGDNQPIEFPKPVYHFPEPIAPYRAAAIHGVEIDIGRIQEGWSELPPGNWVVEGAGGLLVPINSRQTTRDLIHQLGLRMVIVASSRLGTINHTLLTIEAAQKQKIEVAGVILVGDEDPELERNLELVTQIPILTRIPKMTEITPKAIATVARERINVQVLSKIFNLSSDWVEQDQNLIWHPYSQHGLGESVLPVVSGKGAHLKLADGREVLDGISSWWVNIHGHAHPEIAQAIAHQAQKLEHVLFAGFTHEPAVRLAQALVGHESAKKAGLSKVFYSDNGSTAIEVALKMAFQYHVNRGEKTRERFLAFANSYHGDTLGAMAVGEPEGFHKIFRTLLPQVDFVTPGDLRSLQQFLEQNRGRYAAFVFEPLVQGAAGMKMHSPHFLKEAMQLCQAEGIITIADEVFTGFYRTGTCFAIDQVGIGPDLLCLSKGITGGFLPLAVTLTSQRIFAGFLSKDVRTAFLHGHSYTANPIACAAALASWNILQTPECQSRVQEICRQTEAEVQKLRLHPRVSSVRSLGTIGVIEVEIAGDYYSGHLKTLAKKALDRGVMIRPLGNVIYVVPPYCTTPSELSQIYSVIRDLL